jgi:hypothetical protein
LFKKIIYKYIGHSLGNLLCGKVIVS